MICKQVGRSPALQALFIFQPFRKGPVFEFERKWLTPVIIGGFHIIFLLENYPPVAGISLARQADTGVTL